MGIQQRLYAQAHCNPSHQKSLDNQYTNMISSVMLPRQITLSRPFHPANSFAPILLQTLEVSCASFGERRPVFSITCRLFCKIPGGGGTSTFPCQASPTPSYAPRKRLYPLWPQSIAHTSRHHGGVPLKRGLIVN